MNHWLDLLGNVTQLMRIAKVGCLLGLPFGKTSGVMFNATTGAPINGTAGWAPGALFHNTINGLVYRNAGSITSSTWLPLVSGSATGARFAAGRTALDGTNPTPVVTGLSSVLAATVTLENASAPGVGTSVLTLDNTDYATGQLDVRAWKVTATGDSTLIASTGTETFDWVAVGL